MFTKSKSWADERGDAYGTPCSINGSLNGLHLNTVFMFKVAQPSSD